MWGLVAAVAVGLTCVCSTAQADLSYYGVNLTGPEFGEGVYPGVYGTNYTYPTSSDVDYFMSKGMNTFRVPFSWERMQPTASGLLDADQLSLMDTFVSYATSQGANVILDPQNFAAYYGEVIDAPGSDVTSADFANLWSQLADHYKDNDHVIFGLMNEPVGLGDSARPGGTTEAWLNSANAAISAIRATGASNLILVPGNGYTSAGTWDAGNYGTPNAQVMGGIFDKDNNFAFEVHLYLDQNGSGSSDDIYNNDPQIGVKRLFDFTEWLEENNYRGFLGEFGVSSGDLQAEALDNLLNFVDDHSDAWLGWTYWAAGDWYDNSFSIQPKNGVDAPQLSVLEDHMPAAVPEPGTAWLLVSAGALVLFVGGARRLRLAA